jgi:hypothetical protein
MCVQTIRHQTGRCSLTRRLTIGGLLIGSFGIAAAALSSCGVDAASSASTQKSVEAPKKASKCARGEQNTCETPFVTCVRGAATRAQRCYETCNADEVCEERCNTAAVTAVAACRTERERCDANERR